MSIANRLCMNFKSFLVFCNNIILLIAILHKLYELPFTLNSRAETLRNVRNESISIQIASSISCFPGKVGVDSLVAGAWEKQTRDPENVLLCAWALSRHVGLSKSGHSGCYLLILCLGWPRLAQHSWALCRASTGKRRVKIKTGWAA